MNTKTLPLIAIGMAALAGGLCMQPAQAAPKPAIKKAAPLPEIWQKLTPSQRLQYVRAAELDATRILAERIMGISLDGESTVRDLAAASDSVKGQIATTLRGVKTTESPTYHDDGRVEVVRAVKVRSLIESIRKISGKEGAETTQSATVEEIDALGNAAIPGSLGHSRVMAKRAAELDVYRRLAERACGIQVTAESTMRDFVVSSDTLKTSFSNTLKSAEITGISFNDDGTAEVTARLKVGPLIRTIIREKEASGKVLNVSESTEQTVLEETGMGAAPAEGGSSGPAEAPVMREVENIAETVLDMDTVL